MKAGKEPVIKKSPPIVTLIVPTFNNAFVPELDFESVCALREEIKNNSNKKDKYFFI
jgi:hypothetical protein